MTTTPDPFDPAPLLAGGHRMTLYAWARPRRFPALPAAEVRYFQVAPDTRVLAHCHWQADRAAAPTVLLLHGLEGSSDSHYMRGMAEKAWRRGCNVVRLNQRNCGGTEHLTPGLYHSGLTADPLAVLRELAESDGLSRLAVCGYSLGGNIALKLAGELEPADAARVAAVAAVSPPIELAHCADALERRANAAYQWNFLRGLRGRLRRKVALYPDRYSVEALSRVDSVRTFDDLGTRSGHQLCRRRRLLPPRQCPAVLHRLAVPALLARRPTIPSCRRTRPRSDPGRRADPDARRHRPRRALLSWRAGAKALTMPTGPNAPRSSSSRRTPRAESAAAAQPRASSSSIRCPNTAPFPASSCLNRRRRRGMAASSWAVRVQRAMAASS
ncbi:MAG: alpha/beta fold hydrolase [Vicinamibacterales bacterium]